MTGLVYNPTAAGDRVTFTHAFTDPQGNPATPSAVILTPRIAAADGAITTPVVLHLVSVSSTTFIVRCNVDDITFDAVLLSVGGFGEAYT